MGADQEPGVVDDADRPAVEHGDADELRVELELLRDENQRLRTEYVRARRASHRRAAAALGGIAVLAVLGGIGFPAQGDVLFAIAAIAGIAGVLTAYLTPERFIAASVGAAVYRELSRTIEAMIRTLGLSEARRYVPLSDAGGDIRLYVPEREGADLPDPATLRDPFVVPAEDGPRGLSIRPAGDRLLAELEGGGGTFESGDLVTQIDVASEAVVQTFELAEAVDPEFELDEGRARFAVTGNVYGPLDRLDHPVPSTLACGIAVATDTAVTVEITRGDDRVDWIVGCSWDPAAAGATTDAS